jgi:hypothetical protein
VLLVVSGGLAAAAVTSAVLVRAAGEPARRPLVLGAAIAASLTPLIAGIESPTDTEAALTPAALTLGALYALLTLALTLTVVRDRSTIRLATAGAVGLVALAVLVLIRSLEPGLQLMPMVLLGAVLLGGVGLLVADWPDGRPSWRRWLPQQLVLILVYPTVTFFFLILTITIAPIAGWFTALAGNVAVNSADSDTLYAVTGCAAGYAIGWLILAINGAPSRSRPTVSIPTT